MRFLRYATATILPVGPFLTSAGVRATTLTITNERISLVAGTYDNAAPTNVLDNIAGATSGTNNDLNYISGNDAAMMQLELSAANLTRYGNLFLTINDATDTTHVPYFETFHVLPQMVFDSLFNVTDRLDVNVTHVTDTAQTARDLGATLGAAGAGLTAVPWNAAWDAEVQSEVTDALQVTIPDSIPADGTIPSVQQALYMLTQFMLERSVVSTTMTVKKANGVTSLFTLTLDSATTPTTITRAT